MIIYSVLKIEMIGDKDFCPNDIEYYKDYKNAEKEFFSRVDVLKKSDNLCSRDELELQYEPFSIENRGLIDYCWKNKVLKQATFEMNLDEPYYDKNYCYDINTKEVLIQIHEINVND